VIAPQRKLLDVLCGIPVGRQLIIQREKKIPEQDENREGAQASAEEQLRGAWAQLSKDLRCLFIICKH